MPDFGNRAWELPTGHLREGAPAIIDQATPADHCFRYRQTLIISHAPDLTRPAIRAILLDTTIGTTLAALDLCLWP